VIFEYTFSQIVDICRAEIVQQKNNIAIRQIHFDTRKIVNGENSLFIALHGQKRNGNSFAIEAYQKGVRNFIFTQKVDFLLFPDANILITNDSLDAFQALATHFRNLQIPMQFVGITGSNGKTIIKEWLYFLFSDKTNLYRSPNSYNSQIGVAYSLSLMMGNEKLALIEAGISQTEEMEKLESMIKPQIGILTHLGDAHQANFTSFDEKLKEKLKLFKDSDWILCTNEEQIYTKIKKYSPHLKLYTCGLQKNADVHLKSYQIKKENTILLIDYKGINHEVSIPFKDKASIENALYCAAFLLLYEDGKYFDALKFQNLPTLSMRLELKKAKNNSILINDAYSADLNSLQIALEFLNQQAAERSKLLILSDFEQNITNSELYKALADKIKNNHISQLIAIGENFSKFKSYFEHIDSRFYKSTNAFIKDWNFSETKDKAILLKGARKFTFEKIALQFEIQHHSTRMEINLSALEYNLSQYRSLLKSKVKIMVMVKAFAYGSGTGEIARWIEHQKVDYLAVAFADEGVKLRKAGIKLPIMVMNTNTEDFENICRYHLEPEIYNFKILDEFRQFLIRQKQEIYPVHLKLDTGMHRLGFEENEMNKLLEELSNSPQIKIQSVFSHLASADERSDDTYTHFQITQFKKLSHQIQQAFNRPILRHILNSAGIERFPDAQFEMVRLGIGLYGVSPNKKLHLRQVSSLKTIITQIKELSKGQTVGYNRKGVLNVKSKIATIPIGYADGFRRAFSNGNLSLYVKGKYAPVIGNICMDMSMIDVTGIAVEEGDEVEIFGENQSLEVLAKSIDSSSYEILTGISERVKRVYFYE